MWWVVTLLRLNAYFASCPAGCSCIQFPQMSPTSNINQFWKVKSRAIIYKKTRVHTGDLSPLHYHLFRVVLILDFHVFTRLTYTLFYTSLTHWLRIFHSCVRYDLFCKIIVIATSSRKISHSLLLNVVILRSLFYAGCLFTNASQKTVATVLRLF